MTYKEKAIELFMDGANCAQAVFAAFSPMTGIDYELALRLSSSFGGGLGRQREVCGAVSGMCMVAGVLYGYSNLSDDAEKKEHYRMIQELCSAFRERFGTIICRELLDEKRTVVWSDPSPRTAEYYRQRPCAAQVGIAAEIIENYIMTHPPKARASV